jgi:methyltransferase
MSAAYIILSLVVLERLAELALAHRNTKRLKAAGAVEHGAGHYPLFVVLHAAWLFALFFTVRPTTAISWPLIAIYGLLMVGRVWVVVSLGRFWTTRVITLSGAPLVRRGPYRFLRHPNYLIVTAELLVLPLAFGAWWIALVFSALNFALILHRIRIEEAALDGRRAA